MPPPMSMASASPMLPGTADTRGGEPWRSPLPPDDQHRQHQRAVPISPAVPPLGEAGATYHSSSTSAAALDIGGMAVGEDEEGGGRLGEEPLDTTYFDQLPPEPEGECPPELQQRVIDFLSAYAEAGTGGNNGGRTGFTENLKQKKDFGNPELLQRVIEVFGIDQHSSNYPPHLFDPQGYAPEDYIDQIRALQRQLEMEAISGSQVQVGPIRARWVGCDLLCLKGPCMLRPCATPLMLRIACLADASFSPFLFLSRSQTRMAVGVSLPPPTHLAAVPGSGMPGAGVGAGAGAGGPPPLPPGAASALQRAQAAAAAMGVGPGAGGQGRPSKWGAAGAGAGAATGGGGGAGAAGGSSSGAELVQGALAALQARWQQQQQQGPGQGLGQGPGQGSRPPSHRASPQVAPHMSREGSSVGSSGGEGQGQGRRSKFSDLPPR